MTYIIKRLRPCFCLGLINVRCWGRALAPDPAPASHGGCQGHHSQLKSESESTAGGVSVLEEAHNSGYVAMSAMPHTFPPIFIRIYPASPQSAIKPQTQTEPEIPKSPYKYPRAEMGTV